MECLKITAHQNKLKRGHLIGNRFEVILRESKLDLKLAEEIKAAVLDRGLPNFYGVQRFGGRSDNAALGLAVLKGRFVRNRFLKELYLSAWQSQQFNSWLSDRIKSGDFSKIRLGDIAKIEGRGSLFSVEDLAAESLRFAAKELNITGPLFGAKLMSATGQPGNEEEELLDASGIEVAQLKRARLNGSRRAAKLNLADIEIELHEENALSFKFELPKGAYATNLLREFQK